MKKGFFAILSLTAILLLSCGSRQHKAVEPAAPADSLESAPVVLHGPDSLNDAAAVFAGIPVDSASAYFSLTKGSMWEHHSKSINEKWAPCKAGLDKAATFAADSLSDIRSRARVVLYPFSGPDLAYPTALFPDADTIITAALEPLGKVIGKGQLNKQTYDRCAPALTHIMRLSYFITQSMAKDLGTEGLGGVTPVYEFFLTRLGYEILSIEYPNNQLLVIRYFKKGENKEKVLMHFRVNLGDKGMPAVYTDVLDKLDPEKTVGMVKSCSYLLHSDSFSKIREYLLTKTFAIAMDDTGPRYAKLLDAGYGVTLYGSYSHPLSCFSERHNQPDLEKAYHDAPRRPIDFRYGYARNPLFIVARKK